MPGISCWTDTNHLGTPANDLVTGVVVAPVLVFFALLLCAPRAPALTWEHRGTVKVKIDGDEVTWTGHVMRRAQRDKNRGLLDRANGVGPACCYRHRCNGRPYSRFMFRTSAQHISSPSL